MLARHAAQERSILLVSLAALLLFRTANGDEHPDPATESTQSRAAESAELVAAMEGDDSQSDIDLTTQEVQPPAPIERIEPRVPVPPAAAEMATRLYGPGEITRSFLAPERQERAARPGTTVVVGSESKVRPSTDAGSLLGKSQSPVGVQVQRRTPIVTDPRSRGTRTGQLLAAGSYWVPARQDLDTMLSKIDSSLISDIIVVKGPYSVWYGPGFSFTDFQLLGAPRYRDGLQWHGNTSLNYQTNGEQWYGRQTLQGGAEDWGVRIGYGHRTGSDYDSGDGTDIPSSYKSRDLDTALGFDLSPDSHLELNYLRLDQTDVEFPGQIFDIDFLVTDGYDVKYVVENHAHFDRLTLDAWYNRTRFEGDAQRSGKRRQIPQLDTPLNFFGETDVDMVSSGYRLATTCGQLDCPRLTFGVDLRYVEQELNEFDSFEIPGAGPSLGNFPIPRSHSSNPGLFIEQIVPVGEQLVLTGGARADWVSTNKEGTTAGRSDAALLAILGADDFERDFTLWSAYVTAEYRLDDHWTAVGGVGHAERPPTLTELYAVDPFLAILQQGFTQVRGNLNLDIERLWQIDLALKAEYRNFRAGISGFYSWVNDYITYQARDDTLAAAASGGLGVTFVNTDLATLSGGELYGEYDCESWLTPFALLSYVEGRDHSRGSRGITAGSDEEPLAGIAPLQSRVGLRLHEPAELQRWGVELAARIVDNQDRVATSLLEQATPGFTIWDLRGYWHATDKLLLVAGVENFTDKNYREHLDLRTGNGVRQPGVNSYLGFELTY